MRMALRLAALGLGVIGLAMTAGCGKGAAVAEAGGDAPVAGVPIRVATVEGAEIQRSVLIVGSLDGFENATLSNRVSGVVTKVLVDVGSRVKPGESLAEIDPERSKLAVDQATETLQEDLAKLGLDAVPGEDFNVDETSPVKRAISELKNYQSKQKRAEELHQQKMMSDFEFLDTTTNFQVAQSALQSARDDARALLAAARRAVTQIALAKKDFNDSVIKAPDGTSPSGQVIDSYVVSQRMVTSGEYMKEGSGMFALVADHFLKLRARVPERFLAQVRVGQEIRFKVEAYPGEVFTGKVSLINPAIDTLSRTFVVEAVVDNKDGRLRAGGFVQGEITKEMDKDVPVVPQEAVTSFAGVQQVFVVNGGSVKQVVVVPGQAVDRVVEGKVKRFVELRELKVGDVVAVSGQSKLADETAVRVVDGK